MLQSQADLLCALKLNRDAALNVLEGNIVLATRLQICTISTVTLLYGNVSLR